MNPCFAVAAAFAAALASAADQRAVQARRVEGTLTLDGKLDESFWRREPDFAGFVLLGKEAEKAKLQTRGWLGYDDENLYLAFQCDVPDEKQIVARGKHRDMDISSDDCVEIFLDTDRDRDTYYHLMINSLGTQYDASCGRGGAAWDFSWNALWDVRTSLGEKCWFAELRIPWSSLEITPKVGSTWGINIGRERSGEVSYWAPAGGFHKPEGFGKMAGLQVDFSHFCISVGAVQIAGCLDEAGELSTITRVALTSLSDGDREVAVRADPGMKGAPSKAASLTLKKGKQEEVTLFSQPVAAGKSDVLVSVLDKLSQKPLCTAWRQTDFEPSPVRAEIVEPGYRRTLYASQAEKRISLQALVTAIAGVPDGTELIATLSRGATPARAALTPPLSQGEREERKEVPRDGAVAVSFDLGSAEDGAYTVRLALATKAGKRFGGPALAFRKLPASPAEVRLGSNGEWRVGGKPFFPIVLFGVAADHGGMKVYEEVTKGGFNSSLYVGAHQANEAERFGFKLMPHFDAKYQGHPAILGWYYQEEHDLDTKTPPEQFVKGYHGLCKADPYRPVLSLCYNSGAFYGAYGDTADVYVIEPYLYPKYSSDHKQLEEKLRRYISWIDTTVDAARVQSRKLGTRKSVLVAAQGWDSRAWNCRFDAVKARDDRTLSLLEERLSAYLAVIHGANGIGWYNYMVDYWNMHMNPLFWEALRGVAQEMQWLTPAFFGEVVDGVKADHPAIHVIARKHDGEITLIAANTSLERLSVQIEVPESLSGKRLYVLSEARSVRVRNRRLADTFDGFWVHIYTTKRDLPSLPIARMLRDEEFLTAPKRQRVKGNLASQEAGAVISSSFQMFNVPHFMFANDDNLDSCWITREWFEGWKDKPKEPDWLQITFPEKKRIDRVVVHSWLPKYMDDPVRVLSDFELRYLDGAEWKLLGKVEGNRRRVVRVKLPVVEAEKLRLVVRKGLYVAEIEVFGP